MLYCVRVQYRTCFCYRYENAGKELKSSVKALLNTDQDDLDVDGKPDIVIPQKIKGILSKHNTTPVQQETHLPIVRLNFIVNQVCYILSNTRRHIYPVSDWILLWISNVIYSITQEDTRIAGNTSTHCQTWILLWIRYVIYSVTQEDTRIAGDTSTQCQTWILLWIRYVIYSVTQEDTRIAGDTSTHWQTWILLWIRYVIYTVTQEDIRIAVDIVSQVYMKTSRL